MGTNETKGRHRSYGPIPQQRTKRFLEALLAYVNHELDDCDHLKIEIKPQTEDNQLVVKTKVRVLAELTEKYQRDSKLSKDHIKEALHCLEKFLKILEDCRTKTQGSEEWHFKLKLWKRRQDIEANLKQFDQEWERRREESGSPVPPPPWNDKLARIRIKMLEAKSRWELESVLYEIEEFLKSYPNIPEGKHLQQQILRALRSIPARSLSGERQEVRDEESQEIRSKLPDGPVPLNSIFYVERPPIESRCYETILHTGALIRIKAPRQMGKTSLLERIVDRAAKQGYQTVRLNLLQAEKEKLSSLNQFLRWFCACVSHKLGLSSQLDDCWDEDRGSIVNCTAYFEEHLLEKISPPLVLALDEVDRVFQSSKIAQGFFPMLRSWHEEAKTMDIWEKLRLVVVHSTEDYGPLDINQSPFNVGLPIELPEFTSEQVEDLARRYKLNWDKTQVQHLMAMVGGHPYLVRLALYQLARQDLTLESLLQDAPTDAGIYEEHLRRHLDTFKENSQLAAALKQVVTTTEPVRLETMQAYKLYSMGIIKRKGDRVTPRCQLYQQYFRERLSN